MASCDVLSHLILRWLLYVFGTVSMCVCERECGYFVAMWSAAWEVPQGDKMK